MKLLLLLANETDIEYCFIENLISSEQNDEILEQKMNEDESVKEIEIIEPPKDKEPVKGKGKEPTKGKTSKAKPPPQKETKTKKDEVTVDKNAEQQINGQPANNTNKNNTKDEEQ